MTSPANTALGYVRVSTEKQVLHGCSLDAQEERIRAYCKMAGLSLADIVREEGECAGRPLHTRPAGRALQVLLAGGAAKHVVILKLDRAFRDTIDCLTQTREWDKKGIAFHVIDMGGQTLNTASPMGRMFLTLCAGFAELERGLISERTRLAMQFKKSQGARFGGKPFADPAALTRIFELRAEGRGYHAICSILEAEGVPTMRGGRWQAETVRGIVRRNANY